MTQMSQGYESIITTNACLKVKQIVHLEDSFSPDEDKKEEIDEIDSSKATIHNPDESNKNLANNYESRISNGSKKNSFRSLISSSNSFARMSSIHSVGGGC